jgi:hypothetical protein
VTPLQTPAVSGALGRLMKGVVVEDLRSLEGGRWGHRRVEAGGQGATVSPIGAGLDKACTASLEEVGVASHHAGSGPSAGSETGTRNHPIADWLARE